MKKGIVLSTLAAFLFAGVVGLQANELKAGVTATAKAKVEEVEKKENFKTKEDMPKFKKEAAADEKKVIATDKAK
jgi:hypothetical protein